MPVAIHVVDSPYLITTTALNLERTYDSGNTDRYPAFTANQFPSIIITSHILNLPFCIALLTNNYAFPLATR